MSQLRAYLKRFISDKVTLSKNEIQKAKDFWDPTVENILQYVRYADSRFAGMIRLNEGSYYERCKVGEPDEFDLMLDIKDLELDGETYVYDGMSEPPTGFTRVRIGMEEEEIWGKNRVNAQGMLSASHVKSVFLNLVKSAIGELEYEGYVKVSSHGPAVTLLLTNFSDGKKYSVDLVPAIKVNSWPKEAIEWIKRPRGGWPDQNLVHDIWQDGCYLVAKFPKGSNVPECEKEFLWRYSFSVAEKKLFQDGDQGEAGSCSKQVLKILKAMKEELGWQPLNSYHLKTMLFYEHEEIPHHSQWRSNLKEKRLLGLLERLENCLRQRCCPHYFIRQYNLFETLPQKRCNDLIEKIHRIRLYLEGLESSY